MSLPWRKLFIYWFPLAGYVALIFFLSSLSQLPFRLPNIHHLDKILHFCEYWVMAFLLARALASLAWPGVAWGIWVLAIGISLGIGLLDELFQSTVPLRQSDLFDAAADFLGGCAGSGLYLLSRHWISKCRKKKLG
jgi:VanZ family protein